MNAVRIVRTFAIVAVVAGGVMLTGNTQAQAGNYYNNNSYNNNSYNNNSYNNTHRTTYNAPRHYQQNTYVAHKPVCRYQKVTKFEYRTQRFTSWVTKYKPCGTPYRVQVVRTKVVKVPVIKWVKVCH